MGVFKELVDQGRAAFADKASERMSNKQVPVCFPAFHDGRPHWRREQKGAKDGKGKGAAFPALGYDTGYHGKGHYDKGYYGGEGAREEKGKGWGPREEKGKGWGQ